MQDIPIEVQRPRGPHRDQHLSPASFIKSFLWYLDIILAEKRQKRETHKTDIDHLLKGDIFVSPLSGRFKFPWLFPHHHKQEEGKFFFPEQLQEVRETVLLTVIQLFSASC